MYGCCGAWLFGSGASLTLRDVASLGGLSSLGVQIIPRSAGGEAQWRALPANANPARGSGDSDIDDVVANANGDFLFRRNDAFDSSRGVWWEVPKMPGDPSNPVAIWAGNRLIVLSIAVEREEHPDLKPRKYAWMWDPALGE